MSSTNKQNASFKNIHLITKTIECCSIVFCLIGSQLIFDPLKLPSAECVFFLLPPLMAFNTSLTRHNSPAKRFPYHLRHGLLA